MAPPNVLPDATFWIDDSSGNIGTVNLASGATTPIGNAGVVLTDIAFSPSGILFGETFTGLYRINQTTGAATKIGNFGAGVSLNGLVFSDTGTLYSSGGTGLYTINTTTGATTLVGNSGLAHGFTSEGDLAFVGGSLYESVTNGLVSDLARINPATGAATVVGQVVGNSSLFGLISQPDGTLYGVDRTSIYSINLTTGAGTLVQSYSSPRLGQANGAASPTEALTCFLRGTQIATPDGEIKVERLAPGDAVVTASGEIRRIVWVGEGCVHARRGQRNGATPVIIRKGAFADNVPYADLRVTKGHAFCIDDVLIPVEFLVNHRSIVWDDHAQDVPLYHIELDEHDVLLANGAPAESYRDDGNRWLFSNANSGWGLPPKEPCAPILTGGKLVDAIWRRLLDRAGLRPGLPLTDDPDLHLLVDDTRVAAAAVRHGVHTFRLPAQPRSVRIVSRAAAPAELGVARDPRVLGLAVRKVTVWDGARLAMVEAEDDKLAVGFHNFEPEQKLRWTNGDATLPAELFAAFKGPLDIDLHVTGNTLYPLLASNSGSAPQPRA